MIKAVIFDIDNTLYDFDAANETGIKAVARYASPLFSISEDEFVILQKQTQDELVSRLGNVAASHSRLIRYQLMLEKYSLPFQPHLFNMHSIFWDTLIANARPFPDAEAAMKLIKERGLKTGIGTNMTALIQFRKLERMNLLQYLDFMVSSEEAGMEKPDPGLFLLCAKKAEAAPDECIFVGDSLTHDVRGASAAGMKALWYRPALSSLGDRDFESPDTSVSIITSLRQIGDYI